MKNLNAISEASYLSTGNTPQYRRIMRCFFQEYEKMHFQLYKEEVMDLLKNFPGYEEYSIEQLKLDLNMLVDWKNLTPIQDPRKVYTIEEYKNKQFRYSMSEYAVEIERLTVKLENLFLESGNLSSSYIVRMERALQKEEGLELYSSKDINEWWNNLQEDFKRLNQNYQDYLREFYSGKAEKLLKSVEFILHKDRFITYLREFIKELQINAAKIEGYINKITQNREKALLEKIIQSELDIPHPLSEIQEPMEAYIRNNVYGKWRALKAWFIAENGRQSECGRVLDITDEIIRKIIQNAALIVQLQNWGISRKEDYKKCISLFLESSDIREAHKLAAHVFGIQHIRHYKVNSGRSTDSINSSAYEEETSEYLLKPRTRAYRARIDRSGFESKTWQKLAQRKEYLEQAEKAQKMVMRYIKGNKVDFSAIDDVITVSARDTFLRWISNANLVSSRTGRTEYGQEYRLVKADKKCTLKCEDGDLIMPAYILEFTEEQHAGSQGTDREILDKQNKGERTVS